MLPDKPYAGLTFYENDQHEIFAGRDREAIQCGDLLYVSDVVILHGRTGCGKSSFLRAGLRPLLAKSGVAIAFPKNTRLRVVRSGVRPLRSVSAEVWEIAKSIMDGQPLYQGGNANIAEEIVAGRSRKEFVEEVGSSSSHTIKALTQLTETFQTAPIIVIDQAEEYLTLVDSELDGSKNKSRDARLLRREQSEFFNFISRAARGQLKGVRLIVSLRSEYKGEFDDAVYKAGPRPGDRYSSFKLEEMNKRQLIEAIRRPTLTADELADVIDGADPKSLPNLRELFDFSYADGVPEKIAEWLLDKTRVTQGGLLPAMQVACLRLYETSKRNRKINQRSHHIITETEVRRLGKDASNQVSEYLREKVQGALRTSLLKHNSKRRFRDTASSEELTGEYPQAVDDWYDGLCDALVRTEADGRATTRSVPESGDGGLLNVLENSIGSRVLSGIPVNDLTPEMMKNLKRDNVIRSEVRDETEHLTLGHDSLALALNNWRATTGRSRTLPNKMGMNSPKAFERYNYEDLFGEEEILNTEVDVPTDYMWDHQIPHFASVMGFDTRLGINLRRETDLSVLGSKGKKSFASWSQHRKAIIDHERSLRDDFSRQVMVPGDILSFPGDQGKGQWTDLLVTDLFQGNSLVGATEFGADLFEHDKRQPSDRLKLQAEGLTRIMTQLVELEHAEIFVTQNDKSAIAFLELACEFAGVSFDALSAKISPLHFRYTPKDMLFERMLGMTSDEDDQSNKFMVCTAYGRALSEQSGFKTYFSAAHLVDLADSKIEASQDRNADLVQKVQQIFQHTLWQIGIVPSQWTDSENRATVLRLASIGYYTAEYIRAAPDVFVNFLHEWVNREVLTSDDQDDADVGSNQLGIDVIKEAAQACFSFLSFDEYPRLVFHLEATRAYWWDMTKSDEEAEAADKRKLSTLRRSGAKSVAHEIYLELCQLKAETLAAFDDASSHLRSLRWSGDLDSKDAQLVAALADIERAWRNYKIFNFFDSQRQMRSAAAKLQQCIERFQRSASTASSGSKKTKKRDTKPKKK